MKVTLTVEQIDRAVATLEYFSTRSKPSGEKDEEGKPIMVPNPCSFPGQTGWDIGSNEALLRDMLHSHIKTRKRILQKHMAEGMPMDRPTAAYMAESSKHEDAKYEVDIKMIPVEALNADENEIPSSYRSAIHFMVDFGDDKVAGKATANRAA